MSKQKVKIEYDPESNLKDIVILEKTIKEVAEAAKKLNASRLSRRAVVVLLQDFIGATKISKKQIEAVLNASEELSKRYLKPEK